MKIFSKLTVELARILKKGGIGVIPTDTIYGVVGSALSQKAVARIYRLKKRRPDKPMIILIGSLKDLEIFGIKPDRRMRTLLREFWPGKVSVILPCAPKKFFYLHRGRGTLAFRLPAPKDLKAFLRSTGPLVAPSANLEGKLPAKTVKGAQKHFGDEVDFYVDKGRVVGNPSAIVELRNGSISVLRKGEAEIKRKK